jgi:S1-C subfamily serine protease
LEETEGYRLRQRRAAALTWVSAVVALAVPPAGAQDPGEFQSGDVLDELGSTLGQVAEEVLPSVVTIISRTVVSEDEENVPVSILLNSEMDPFGADDVYSNPGIPRSVLVMEEQASGVIISTDGYVITSFHAVSGAYEVDVHLADGRVVQADVVGGDSQTDIALVKIPGDGYQAITPGDSDLLTVGQFILSFGSPFSLTQTMSFGIISYLGRCDLGFVDYENYIQTDVLLNPGSSGGALVNLRGELIGINAAIATETGSYHGIGFAVPVNQAMQIAEQIRLRGDVSRGYMGLIVRPLTPGQLVDSPGCSGGVFVAVVLPGSAAERGGVRRGDVLLTVDGREMGTVYDFRFYVAGRSPGQTATLGLLRDGEVMDIDVVLDEKPDDDTVSSVDPFTGIVPGWALSETSDGTVKVDRVGLTGPAAMAGLCEGDIILAVNHVPLTGIDDLYMSLVRSGTEVLLTVSREGRMIYFYLKY